MPKIVPSEELDRVEKLIAQYPEGIGAKDIAQQLDFEIKGRTLQRRLATLVAERRIVSEGDGRALKYKVAKLGQGVDSVDVVDGSSRHFVDEVYIPISPEGEEIKSFIRQPRTQRSPVSYQPDFLGQYYPNNTYYLPASLRKQLHALGRSPAEQTPAGTFARDILNRLLIDLSWASSRLEGNTYSRLDTERLIEFGQAAEGKDVMETQMILNHKSAIEYLVRDTEHADVAAETIIAVHAFLSDGLLADPMSCGRLRNRAVDIGGSVYLPIAMPQRIAELFGIVMNMAAEINDPFEQSFFLMVHLPYLQPFEDVNKRVSRLAANIPLIQHNLCPLSFIDVPQQAYVDAVLGVYELNRIELLRDVYIWAYERSCQQYVAVQQQLVPPDIVRLRYRNELAEVIRAIVREGTTADETSIMARIPDSVSTEDKQRFIILIQNELKTLHAGNAIRFGLRPLEFSVWQQQYKTDHVE
ncbi:MULTISPECIES: Fic family protein [Methylomonas]|uniref:Cell filamentation protein Fic n=2 Tax=Methylomonas TaxID=416 RepID=A0A140E799_9GAMM|nr:MULTISPECIES: Fic family protein [Methylomonas]AMK79273.1 cell filamentation protein Fic [Methylomonas denitrificans]OAI03291.1 cell filamentation protein Fic [Methylomonas methanica]TCV86208.1 Fic family protein [Methylomonas methanica]